MLIRTLTRAAGRITFSPGQVLQVDAELGRQLVAAHAAEDITPALPPAVEAAAEAPPAKAPAKPKTKSRRR